MTKVKILEGAVHYVALIVRASGLFCAANAQDVIPIKTEVNRTTIASVVELYGKSTSSDEFVAFARKFDLKHFSTKNEIMFIDHKMNQLPYPFLATHEYGGSGLLVVATSTRRVAGDEALKDPPRDLKVVSIRLIVGPCFEQEMFGTWNGEMPLKEIPKTPERLLQLNRHYDTDDIETSQHMGGSFVGKQKRVINYYVKGLGYDFPYTFTFWNNELAMITIWPPPRVVPRVVRPQASKAKDEPVSQP